MKEWICKKCGSTEIALKHKGHVNFAFDEEGYITATDVDVWCEYGCCGANGTDIKDIAELKEV